MKKLSLNKAAKEAQVAKSTLLNALFSGEISAKKNFKGHWEIEPSELFRVFPKNSFKELIELNPTLHNTTEKTTKNHALEIEIKMLREQLSRLDMERDRERAQFNEQIETLKKQVENQSFDYKQTLAVLKDQRIIKAQQSLWAKLFG